MIGKLMHRHYHSPWRRGMYALLIVASVMTVGTIGMHTIERMPYLDAFYFMSMTATAQGPSMIPSTPVGKLFAALMSFISVGTVVAALGYLFGPFFTQVWSISIKKFEEEERQLEAKLRKRP